MAISNDLLDFLWLNRTHPNPVWHISVPTFRQWTESTFQKVKVCLWVKSRPPPNGRAEDNRQWCPNWWACCLPQSQHTLRRTFDTVWMQTQWSKMHYSYLGVLQSESGQLQCQTYQQKVSVLGSNLDPLEVKLRTVDNSVHTDEPVAFEKNFVAQEESVQQSEFGHQWHQVFK